MHTPSRFDEPAPSQAGITPVSPLPWLVPVELSPVELPLPVEVDVPVEVVVVPELSSPVALCDPLLVPSVAPTVVPVVGVPVVGVPPELELDALPLLVEVSAGAVSAQAIVVIRQAAIIGKLRTATNKQTNAALSTYFTGVVLAAAQVAAVTGRGGLSRG